MRGKIYTLAEINRALPLIRGIATDIVRGYLRLRAALESLGYQARGNTFAGPFEELGLPDEVRDLLEEIRGWIDELGELGVLVRDLETGLMEAYGEKDGEIVYFSWKPGEDRVRYWHDLFHSPRERRPVHALV
jgi:hypothetical protein